MDWDQSNPKNHQFLPNFYLLFKNKKAEVCGFYAILEEKFLRLFRLYVGSIRKAWSNA
jgi:hypothetical protein